MAAGQHDIIRNKPVVVLGTAAGFSVEMARLIDDNSEKQIGQYIMAAEEKINDFVSGLITEGNELLKKTWQLKGNYLHGPPTYVDLQPFAKWRASCSHLASILGNAANPWHDILSSQHNNEIEVVYTTLGTLEAIRDAIERGYLIKYKNLVFAEAFSNLIEQAEYLLDQDYVLAAGVILRCVLEENLRRMCNEHNCLPDNRPTLGSYNTSLYTNDIYNKVTFKLVDAMAAIGNDAAHNNPELSRDNVERFKRDLVDFLNKYAT